MEAPSADQPDSFKTSDSDTTDATTSLPSATSPKKPIQLGVVQSSSGARPMQSNLNLSKKSRWDQAPGTGENEEELKEINIESHHPEQSNIKNLIKKFEDISGSSSKEESIKSDESLTNKPGRVKLVRSNFSKSEIPAEKPSDDGKVIVEDNKLEEIYVKSDTKHLEEPVKCKALQIISSNYDSPSDESSQEADEISNDVSVVKDATPSDSAYASLERLPKDNGSVGEKTVEELTSSLSLQNLNVPTSDDCCEMEIKDSCELASETEGLNKDDKKVNIGDVDLNNSFTKIKESEISNVVSGDIAIEKTNSVISVTSEKNIETLTDTSQATKKTGDLIQDECHVSQEDIKSKDQDLVVLQSSGGNVVNDSTDNSEKISTMEINRVQTQLEAIELERSNDYENNSNVTDTDAKSENCNTITSIRDNNVEESQDNPTTSLDEKVSNKIRINSPEKLPQEIEPNNSSDDDFVLITHADVEGYNSVIESPSTDCVLTGESSKSIGDNSLAEKILSGPHVKDKSKDSSEINKIIHKAKEIESSDSKETHEIENEEDLESLMVEAQDNKVDDFSPVAEQYERKERNVDKEPICEESLCNEDVLEMFNDGVDAKMEQIFSENSGNVSEETCSSFKQNTEEDLLSSLTNELVEEKIVTNDPIVSEKSSKEEETENILETNDSLLKMLESGGSPETGAHLEDKEVNVITDNVDQSIIEGKEVTQVCEQNNSENEESVKKVGKSTKLTESNVPDSVNVEHEMLEITFSEIVQPVDKTDWPKENSGSIGGKEIIADVPDMESRVDKNKDSQQESDRTTIDQNIEEKIKDSNITIEGSEALFTSKESKFDFGDNLSLESKDDTRNEFQIKTGNNSTDGNLLAKEDGDKLERDGKGALNETNDSEIVIEEVETIESDVMNEDSAQILELEDEVATMERDSKVAQMDIEVSEISEGLVTEEMECAENAQETETTEFTFRSDTLDSGMQMSKVEEDIAIATESETIIENIELMEEKNVSCVVPIENSEATSSIEVPHHETIKQNLTSVEITNAVEDTSLSDKIKEMEEKSSNSNQLDSGQSSTSVISETESSQECNSKNIENSLNFQKEILKETEDTTNSETWSSPVESKLTPINKEGSIEVSQQETIERSIDMLFEIPSNEHPMNSSKSSTSSSSHDKKLEVTSEAKKLFSEEIQKEMLKLSPEHEAQCEEIISNSTESESNDKIMSDSCQLSKESTLNNDIKNDKPTSISDQGGETLPCDASDIATIQAIDSFLEGDNIKTSTSEENEQIKTIDENSKNVATTSSINEKTNAEDVMLGVEGDLDLDNSLSYDTKKLDLSPSSEPAISEETYDLPGESYDKESLDKEQENLHSGVLQNVESSTAQEGSGNSNLIETTPTTCLAETEKSSLNESHLLHETDLEANVKSTRVELPTCSSSLCSDKEQNYIVKLSDVRQSLEKAPLSDKNKFFGGLKHELELKMPRSEVISIEVDGKKLQSGETEKESDQPDLTSKPQVASCTDENIDFENLIPCTAVSSDENLISSPVKSSKEIDAVTDVTEEATGLNKQSESLISNQSKEIKNESNTELGTQRDELIPPVDVSSTKISTDESKNKQPSSSSIDLNTASNTNTEKLASVASKELAVPKSDKMDLIIEEKSKQDADLPNLAEGQTTTVEDSSKDSTEVKSTPLESTSNKIPCDIQKSFTNITPSKEKNTLPLATSSNRGCAATGSVESESSEEVTQSLRRFRFIPTKTDTSVREKPVSTTEPLNEVKITDTDTSELKLLREVDNKNSNVQEDKSAPPIDSGNEASPEVTPVTEQAAKPSKPTTVKDIPAPVRVSARQKQRQAAALAAKEKAEAEKSPGLGSAKKVNIQEKQGDKRGKKSLSPTKELHIKISGKSTESGKQSPLSSQKSPKNLESKINLQVSPKKIAKEVSQDKLEPITLKLSKEDNPVIVRSSSLSPKKNVSPHSPQGKTLGYTLKIGKDSTTIIPKDSTPSPTRRESSPGTGSPKTDLSGKVGYLIKDTGLTITPVAPVETQEQKLSKITLKLSKAGGHPEIKQENKSETWKAIRKLGEIDIVPVEGKSPTEGSKRKDRTDDGSPDKKLKLGDVTVEPSTSSGVSKLQGLLTQAPLNQSDSSEDGKFIGFGSPTEKLSPAQQQSSYDIGMIRHDDSPQPPRKRGRPRKITSPDDIVHSVTVPHSLPTGLTAKDILAASLQHQSLQQHLHQSYQQPQSFQQPQEDLDSSQPMVPLFDLFEDTFIDPSPPTIFPDQVQPSTEIIMRSARGRPIGRSRRPRGSGLLRAHERGGPRGRPRGSRGIKRILEEMEAMSFPDPDQPITLDNIDAEMGPRFSEQAASELTMALLRKSIEGKKEILEKKARKSDGSDEGNSDLDAKVREMKEKIEAAYQAELKSPGKEGKKRTPEKPESNKKSPPGLIPIHQKQDESTRRKSADGKESVKRKLSGDKSGEQPASKRKSTDENLEGSRSETGGTEENTEDSQMEVDQTTSPEEPTTQEEKAEPEPPPKPVKPRPRSKAEIKRIKREKDRLRREAKKLAALEALKAPPPNPCEEDTRMSASDLNGEDGEGGGIKKNRMEVGDPEGKEFTVEQIAEYQWPLQGGELYMIQEQISTWLGVKSFQRKYPDLKRRRVEMEERTYLCDSGLVSESMCDLGLTAVSSSEVLDIMFQDFPDQYEELRKHMREKQARELIQKQKERKKFEQTLSKSDLKEHAIQSLVSWNSNLNKSRNETRKCHLDLQTWTIQYPRSKVAKMTRPTPKLGSYPVALIPGQYSDYYKRYTPQELRYFPVNTVLYGPLQPNEMHSTGGSDGSQSESEDSSSSDGTSDSSSDGEGTEEEEKEKERTKECRTCGSKKSNEAMLQCSQCSHNNTTVTVWA